MKVLDDVLNLLKDGNWHSLQEIQEKTGFSTFKTLLLSNFLISYEFCNYKKETATTPPCITALKLKDNVIRFFKDMEKLETTTETLKNVEFTEEYRNKHWHPCRFGVDPRNCGTEGRITDAWKQRLSDPTIICARDQKPCNARWNY